MSEFGIWQVEGDVPAKLNKSWLELEKNLEDWIESDPGLLQNGLTIVGRQVYVEAGPLDLLALDPQGRWVVIELKAGQVNRDTIAQVVDYASCIATMPFEELDRKVQSYLQNKGKKLPAYLEALYSEDQGNSTRDVSLFVVGTGKDAGLERMADFLASKYEVPINVVTYQVFETIEGQKILVRELAPADLRPEEKAITPKVTVEDVLALADRYGTGFQLRKALEAAEKHGLHVRPWQTSLMFAPKQNKTRALFTLWAAPDSKGEIVAYVGAKVFAEFFPISEERSMEILGEDDSPTFKPDEFDHFMEALDRVFEEINKHQTAE